MKIALLAFTLLAAVVAVSAVPTQLTYKAGDFLSYSFASQVQTGTQSASGALSTMSGTVEVECQEINNAGNYLFAINMFDVVVNAQNPPDASDASRPLGYDMIFEQTPAGQVINIWYQDGDAPYFVEVKTGAINSFHTSVIAAGSSSSIQESDVVGQHTSNYIAAANSDGSLSLGKGFDQNDVTAFVDPNLKSDNVLLKAQGRASVHASGYILATSVQQTVSLTTVTAAASTDPDGWNSMLTAQGSLGLQYKPSAAASRLSTRVSNSDLAAPKYVAGTLMTMSALAARYSRSLAPAQHPVASAEELRGIVSSDLKASKFRKVAAFFRAHPESITPAFEPLFDAENISPKAIQRLFALLASTNLQIAHDMLIAHGILSDVVSSQLAAINTISTSKISSGPVRDALLALYLADPELTTTVSRAAILAYGSVLSHSALNVRKMGIKKLQSYLVAAGSRGDEHGIRVLHSALYNTVSNPTGEVTPPTDGSMPFNKSWSASREYGSPNTIGASFAAEFFVGTNFNCNQDSFNYEALVVSNATANLWTYVQTVFLVSAVYGREGPQVLGNELYLQVFNKVVVDMQIPNEDCKSETYNVGSFTAPGIDVSYTVWVSCIPVVFSAGVSFEADLSWGWSICQDKLFAQVSASPNAKLIVSASAQTDLLIIEGEVAIDADFDVTLVPQAFVDGVGCSVGVDVQLTEDPMEASITAEYRKKKCEWWIFDCKWGPWEQDQLWSWNAQKDNEVLFQQTWKIQ